MLASDLTLGEVRLVAAVVHVDPMLCAIQLDDAGDRPSQELAVVAHHHDGGTGIDDEPFQLLQAREIEIVGGLVEQQDVVPGEQNGRQACARGLSSGQRRHQSTAVDIQAQLGQHFRGPLLKIGPAECEPAFEGRGVAVLTVLAAQCLGRLVHRLFRGGDSGSSADERENRFPGQPLGFLREIADGGVGWAGADLTLPICSPHSGQQRQQRRFSRAVGADETDHVTFRDSEVEPGEQGAIAVKCSKVVDSERRSHL